VVQFCFPFYGAGQNERKWINNVWIRVTIVPYDFDVFYPKTRKTRSPNRVFHANENVEVIENMISSVTPIESGIASSPQLAMFFTIVSEK